MKRIISFVAVIALLTCLFSLTFTTTSAHAQPLTLSWGYGCPGGSDPYVKLVNRSGYVCLWGNGYQGLGDPGGPGTQYSIFSVTGFHTNAWIRYYDGSGGHFCALSWNTYNFNYVTVTQVYIGSTGGYSFCP